METKIISSFDQIDLKFYKDLVKNVRVAENKSIVVTIGKTNSTKIIQTTNDRPLTFDSVITLGIKHHDNSKMPFKLGDVLIMQQGFSNVRILEELNPSCRIRVFADVTGRPELMKAKSALVNHKNRSREIISTTSIANIETGHRKLDLSATKDIYIVDIQIVEDYSIQAVIEDEESNS